jgi:lipoprotein NlpD
VANVCPHKRGSAILAVIMFASKLTKQILAAITAAGLLAGCASTPAPVSNYSFGGSGQPAAAASTAQTPMRHQGAQTFGLGGHANGTVGASGYTVAPGDTLYSIAFANGMDVRDLASLNDIRPPYVIHPGQVLKLKSAQAREAAGGSGTTATTTTIAAGATAVSTHAEATPPPSRASAPVFGPVTSQSMAANGVAPLSSTSVAAMPSPAVPATVEAPASAKSSSPPQNMQAAPPTPPPGATRSVAGIAWQWPASGKVIGGFQAGSGGDGAGLDIAGNPGDPVRAAASGTVVYSGNGLIGYGELIIIKHNDTYLSAYGHNSKRLVKEGDHVSAGQEIALMGASGAPRVELHFEIRKDGKPVDPLAYLPGR